MFLANKHTRLILVGVIVVLLTAFSQSIDRSMAADRALDLAVSKFTLPQSFQSVRAGDSLESIACSDTACPASAAGLPSCIERPKFCVYYTTASISDAQAAWAADITQMYWDRFVALGFDEPKYTDKLRVELLDLTDDCNGGTAWDGNGITVYAGCFDLTLFAQNVIGHELTHRVQYAHDTSPGAPIQTKFLKDGTARATEDNWFSEIDHWADALSVISFNREANAYLLDPQFDITIDEMRYRSCLWWKYAMEQYGSDPDQPELGIDFVLEVYKQNSLGFKEIASINRALHVIGADTTFDKAFRRFGAAIWTKDLSGLPDASYNFIDEEEAGNPAVYGPIVPEDGGTIQVGDSAIWMYQDINKYGLRYYQADIGADCPVLFASFQRDFDSPAFYHIITQDGNAFHAHLEGSGADWTQAFIDDDITSIVAVVGSLGNASEVEITLGCADPVLEIKLPNSVAVARVQAATKFLAQVQVTDGIAGGPVVAGLTNSHFTAKVGGVNATVTGGGYIQEQYWLLIQAPASLADGVYDLEITLRNPATGIALTSGTSLDSVVYTAELTDQALVIDRSFSMSENGRLAAAQEAAAFYVDVTRDGDGLTIVPYNEDVVPEPFDIREVNDRLKANAKYYINALTPEGATSIGDGMAEALSQLNSSPTGNELCSFVLLSDGMENSAQLWADVDDDVIASGCPVTTIAFGPDSNELLMQQIAADTGGAFFYNDVYISSDLRATAATPTDMVLDLANSYEYAQAIAEDRQRLLSEKGLIGSDAITHQVLIDDSVSEALFSLDWVADYAVELDLQLIDPDGQVYSSTLPGYSFEDMTNYHVGYRLTSPIPGTWQLKVSVLGSQPAPMPYHVIVSAKSLITLELLLPDRLGLDYLTGNLVPIYAILSADGPIDGAVLTMTITSPDNTQVALAMHDDGQHNDGAAQDGLYATLYTAVNQAENFDPLPEDGQELKPIPEDEGGYRVLVQAFHDTFYREAIGAFSVKEAPDENQNYLPDTWEKLFNVDNPQSDPDRDDLINLDEYEHGTHPRDADSDDGGENDGSEVAGLRDPLFPDDDLLERPDYIFARPLDSAVLLHYDLKPSYSFGRLYRRLLPGGLWQPVAQVTQDVYTDTLVTNGQEVMYLFMGVRVITGLSSDFLLESPAVAEVVSAGITSEPVTPSADPFPPEALVIINQGATTTNLKDVTLTFSAYELEGPALDTFSDIDQVMLSNDPEFTGAVWQGFKQGIPWTLDVQPGQLATVYARFRDEFDNESIGTELDSILYTPSVQFLPMAMKY